LFDANESRPGRWSGDRIWRDIPWDFTFCGAQKVLAKSANNESQAEAESHQSTHNPLAVSNEALEVPSLQKVLG